MRRQHGWGISMATLCAVALLPTGVGATSADAAADDATGRRSDQARCVNQVADNPKTHRPAGSSALDTGVFTGDPAGASPASAMPVHKDYGGSMRTVWDAAQSSPADTSYLGAVPWTATADAGTADSPSLTIKAAWNHAADVSAATPESLVSQSRDGGAEWSPASAVAGEDPVISAQLRDGRVFAVPFKSQSLQGSITDSTGDPASATPVTLRFTDVTGGTFTPLAKWFRTAGRPIQRTDGTVILPVYGDDPLNAQHWIAALLVATPPVGSGGWEFEPLRADPGAPLSATNLPVVLGRGRPDVNFTEVGLLERPNGSLIAIVRNLVMGQSSGSDTLKWTTSADGGRTWSSLIDLSGMLTGWNGGTTPQEAGVAGGPLPGIAPQLELLANGMIVLSSGKPDNWIAYSATGDATGWAGAYTYRNCPTTKVTPSRSYYAGDDPDQWRYGSSGNTTLARVGSQRVLQLGDNCHNYHWGCVRTAQDLTAQSTQSPYTVDLTSRIWQRQVDVVTPNVGKLDLAGMVEAGTITATGTMTWTSPAHPRAGLRGAFDGSTSYWSSAVASGGAGTITLDLGRAYTLNRVGLSLRPQVAASATVEVSLDGGSWSPLVSRSGVVSRALEYTDVPATSARHVRVTVPAAGGCDAGLATSCAFLNELELYSTVDGFENDPWGNYPRGANGNRAASQVWITADTTGGSHQALRLKDESASSPAVISFPASASATRSVTFRLKPLAWASGSAGGFLFSLDAGTTGVVRLAVFKDGSVHAYNGTSYVPALPAGTVPLGEWRTVTIGKTSSAGRITVGSQSADVPVASLGATVDGYTFGSSGTASVGDHVLVDDVEVR